MTEPNAVALKVELRKIGLIQRFFCEKGMMLD